MIQNCRRPKILPSAPVFVIVIVTDSVNRCEKRVDRRDDHKVGDNQETAPTCGPPLVLLWTRERSRGAADTSWLSLGSTMIIAFVRNRFNSFLCPLLVFTFHW